MRVAPERAGARLVQLQFDRERVLAARQAGAVADAEDVGVDREGLVPEGGVEHDVGGLAADAGQRLQRGAVVGHLAAMVADQRLATAR